MRPPALALIHGLGCSRRAWDRIVPLLRERGLDATPVELPGYGEQSAVETPRTIGAMAAAVEPRIAALGRDVVVAGHSMGGLVATALAERHPAWLRGLIAINSSLTVESRMTAHRGSEGLICRPVVGRAAWAVAPRARLRSGLQSAFAPDFAVPDLFVDDLRACSWATFTRSTAAIDTYLAERALPERLAALNIPVAIVLGTQDLRLDFGVVAEMQARHALPVVEIAGSGHTPMWEAPEATADALAAFAKAPARPPLAEPGASAYSP